MISGVDAERRQIKPGAQSQPRAPPHNTELRTELELQLSVLHLPIDRRWREKNQSTAIMHISPSLIPTALLAWAAGGSCYDTQSPLEDAASSTSHDSTPSYRSDLLSFHKQLIDIYSTSGREAEIGAFLNYYFLEKGWMSTLQVVPPRDNTPEGQPRLNIVAWPDLPTAPNPKVLLSSHIDAVPPFIPYHIDDGEVTKDTRISGRGSVDAKGSVAAMVTAVDELLKAEEISNADVMLAFVVGEEISGDGMRWFNDGLDKIDHKPHFDAVIFGEPTENKLACGHKGALACKLTAHGVGGHSGYPWLGKSANELIVRAMSKIFDADLGSSETYGNTTVNLGRIDGGVAANVIPEKAVADLMIRVALGPQKTGGKVVQDKIQKILDEVDDEAFDFECSQGYGFVEANCDVKGTYTSRSLGRDTANNECRLRDHGSQLRHRHPAPKRRFHSIPLRPWNDPCRPWRSREPDRRRPRGRC